ncbi:hypothetical protein IAQ61_002118 [Plenodomus lingam]|uniref:Predicted protein n=1 Tax=Leptosphaeria maculans (strain JN3 / isolate v23.1.3 / race Av1-4-5-6-7-8) TaxID=985895 RepID=E4ZH55_LEPMJ|nr:predicted protein [Plenodomus lingam JN3]KAH9876758.1 hypothetical protein IAQ61_002118 [Plenodomus lingam]CBX90625.1 predicted protein [Plenodomus lingam JN3]
MLFCYTCGNISSISTSPHRLPFGKPRPDLRIVPFDPILLSVPLHSFKEALPPPTFAILPEGYRSTITPGQHTFSPSSIRRFQSTNRYVNKRRSIWFGRSCRRSAKTRDVLLKVEGSDIQELDEDVFSQFMSLTTIDEAFIDGDKVT